MRKGFTLTLTALALVLLATSALALGPTIKNVPDVYIGPAAATGAPVEPGVNTFRYTDALVLWDYVTPGVPKPETGSTSDTLFWTWAAKNATLAGPTGSFLDPTLPETDVANGIHYSIIQADKTVVHPIRTLSTEGTAAWKTDINGLVNAIVPAGATALNKADALTFRNIRLSPLPEAASYLTPVAVPGLPAGYLDIQQATLYVTDGTTTPGVTTNLLVTVDAGKDFLSGGAVWELVNEVTDTSAWGATAPTLMKAPVNNADPTTNRTTAPSAEMSSAKTATSLSVTTPLTNTAYDGTHTDSFYYGAWYRLASQILSQTNPLSPTNIYRMSVTVASTNASAASNPGMFVGFNGRTTGAGWGAPELTKGISWGPTSAATMQFNAYVIPAEQGDAFVWLSDWDESGTPGYGGTITFSGIKVLRFPLASLSGAVTKLDKSSFAASDYGASLLHAAYGAYNAGAITEPTWTFAPQGAATGALQLGGNTAGSNSVKGFAGLEMNVAANRFTPTAAGKLIVMKATCTGSVVGTGTLPTLWLNVGPTDGSLQGIYLLDRTATSGPNASAKDFYSVLDVPSAVAAGTWSVSFRIIADAPTQNGSITVSHVTVTEYDNPSMP
jgi:hypothetical protein